MTSIVEKARAEADAVEAELGPDDPQPEPEPEPEPTPEPEPEPEPVAITPQTQQRFEKAVEKHREAIAKLLGPDAVTHECFVCAGMGFLAGVPEEGDRFEIAYTEGGVQLIEVPPDVPVEFVQARDKTACDACDGWGQVISGAKNPHHAVELCSKCNGNGWVMKAIDETPMQAIGGYASDANYSVNLNPGNLGPDAWGRPYGHQHWGVPPAEIGVTPNA